MEKVTKLFNFASVMFSVVGGFVCQALGGWDVILESFVALVVIDYITGVLKAIYNKELSSAVGYKGIIKKVVYFIVIATAVVVQTVIQTVVGNKAPLREITILLFLYNEGVSILENASEFAPIPKKLKEVLIQLRDKADTKE